MQEQLEQLVLEAQQAPPNSTDRQQAVAYLAQQILKNRPVARPFRGRLVGVYQEIVEQAQSHLAQLLQHRVDLYNRHRISLGQWAADLRSETLQAVLSRSTLQKLALAAQQYAQKTAEFQYAITQLLEAIRVSGKLARTHLPLELYQDAVNQTLLWVCQNIHAYDCDRGDFMAWVNYRLDKIGRSTQYAQSDPYTQAVRGKIIRTKHQLNTLLRQVRAIDLINWLMLYAKRIILELHTPILTALVTLLSLSIAIQHSSKNDLLFRAAQELTDLPPPLVYTEDLTLTEIPQEEAISLTDILRQYIEEDPDQLLKKHIRDHPEATLQTIILARLEGESWQTLSEKYGIQIPTLSNFFQRSIASLAPKIREAIQ